MDPNATLAKLRDAYRAIHAWEEAPEGTPPPLGAMSDLAEAAEDMDDWLGRLQGFLPDDWNVSRGEVRPPAELEA